MFRKTIFWTHLIAGLLAGLVIFMMSLTGVILTYERQILNWFERGDYISDNPENLEPLALAQLLELGTSNNTSLNPTSIIIKNHNGAPVILSAGRSGSMDLNPYTGEEMAVGSESLDSFFSTITGWHRWFNISGENRAQARAITGASNLIFLFLIVSGIYLWLPRIWRWTMFKVRLLFVSKPANSQARDFNWHHVIGIWCAIPLLFIVATATVFNYSWANNLVYQIYGEEAPQRGRGPAPQSGPADDEMLAQNNQQYMSLDELMFAARQISEQQFGTWESISLNLPENTDEEVSFSINQSIGGQPHKQFTLVLDRNYGTQQSLTGLSDQSPGRQTRSIIRFLHTGEVLGFWGQTIAGVVSLATLFMVWTGFALAYRRLIKPLFIKR
jgi:uncharacterized iron-regulated membrane protein